MPASRIRILTLPVAAATLLAVALPTPASAIEMFTFFGDGSRIGLPSLEVPIEAYPGIPLRSDRLRARRRMQRPVAAPQAQPGVKIGNGITIREMQPVPMPIPETGEMPRPMARPASRGRGRTQPAPVAPSPEDLLP